MTTQTECHPRTQMLRDVRKECLDTTVDQMLAHIEASGEPSPQLEKLLTGARRDAAFYLRQVSVAEFRTYQARGFPIRHQSAWMARLTVEAFGPDVVALADELDQLQGSEPVGYCDTADARPSVLAAVTTVIVALVTAGHKALDEAGYEASH